MEKHKCKLCSRSFSNGRALGGHMRSHLANLPIPPKIHQLSDRTESASSPSSSEEEEEEEEEEENREEEEIEEVEEEEKGLVYGLRENPKKSFKLADPEFSFAVDAGSVVQDRESETESKNPTRRRSKRNRKVGIVENQSKNNFEKKPKLKIPSSTESQTEPEPVSSVSDTSPEEDIAMCLMMLSRDKWMTKEKQNRKQVNEDEEEAENKFCCEKYKCETCKKVFSSYQALGGHRASHKKMRSCFQDESESRNAGNVAVVVAANKKIHECPFCYKVFASGQALGGHKRSHLLGPSTTPASNCAKFGESLIDLNLPAPMEDEEISQLEVSAVSDAEFINPIKT